MNKITGEWSGEFIEGVDFVRLTGKELAAVKAVLNEVPESGRSKNNDSPESGESKRGGAQSMLLLTRDGLNLALMKTRKPAGIRMRRWLASEVLPALQTGEALALADSAALAKAIRAEMSRQLRTPEAKSAELSRLADNCARTLARGDSALMPAIRQWSIELAKGVVGFGGAGRELGYCSTSQFHSMRSLLKGLPNLVSIIPKTKRRAAVKALLGGSKQDVLPFMLEFDAAGIHVEVRATKSEAA